MQTSECRTRETLKRYLAGWVEQEESSAIEAHVLNCNACEQTLSGLESEPDTLVNFLGPQIEPTSGAQTSIQAGSKAGSKAGVTSHEPVLQYAMEKAKELGTQLDEDSAMKPLEVPPKTVGPYELIKSLGHGSMGAVYLGRHQKLGKQVAIKLLSARAFRNDQFTARFQREIRAAGSLNHPAIINATDAGQADAIHYLVMEHIDGMDLSLLTRWTGPLSIADTCCLMHSVALGLSHAHAAGIVHRDIKPSNLMLSRTGQVKILDFGLAQISLWDEASAELTTVGQLMGTIDYMAPEQAERADTVDYRADLYSLGATMFKLLCGRAPLAAMPDLSPLTKLRLLATSQPPSLNTLRPDAPAALVQLVSSLLARDPAARPASAAHVAEMLAEFTAGSDLPKLMKRADEIAATRPKASENRIPGSLTKKEAVVSPLKSNRGNWSSFVSWGVTMSAVALLAAGGIFITIETQKGQLVIESVAANTEIKISKAGKVYDSIQLVPGANATRLYAGSYEVTIEEGSDQFRLDRDKVEIRRGETVIARVHSIGIAPSGQGALPLAAITDVEKTEAVYEGKTLSMWLAEFARERSPNAIQTSLAAITSLADPSNQDRIAKSLLAALPAIPQEHDMETFECIWDVSGGGEKYVAHLLSALDAKNPAWTERAMSSGTTVNYQKNRAEGNRADHDSAIVLLPLMKWIETELLSPGALKPLPSTERSNTETSNAERSGAYESLIHCASYRVISALNDQAFDTSSEDKYLELLRLQPALGPSFWLKLFPKDGLAAGARWRPGLAELIESKAKEYFIDPNTPENYVAQAAMLLADLSGGFDRTGMAAFEPSPELTSALERRLRELAEHPERLLTLVEVDHWFGDASIPSFKTPLFADYQTTIAVNNSPAKCLLTCELFDLVANFKVAEGCFPSIRAIHRSVYDKATQAGVKLAMDPFSTESGARTNRSVRVSSPGNMASISIAWPSGDVRYLNAQLITQPELLAIAIATRAESLLPAEMVKQLRTEQKQQIQTQWIASKVRSLDADQDGFLSPDEMPFAVSDEIDVNLDQKISSEELLKYS
ncbi:MAG: serine/threonine-protein kinase, partial [Pirellulaceae bacterium]|nr:serine/threonine-protein kinase [Pirellulaceae bacterium]